MPHLKRLKTPRTWQVKRKGITFTLRPNPGAHPRNMGLPLGTILRDMLGYAKTLKEAKNILNHKDIIVDGKKRKDYRYIAGLMDVIQAGGKAYRLIINTKGKLELKEAKSPDQKLCAIKSKHTYKGKFQLTLHDGSTIITENKDLKVGDGLLISLPKREIKEHLPLKESAFVYLIGGSHVGEVGTIDHLSERAIVVKTKKGAFETDRKSAFIINKEEI